MISSSYEAAHKGEHELREKRAEEAATPKSASEKAKQDEDGFPASGSKKVEKKSPGGGVAQKDKEDAAEKNVGGSTTAV